MLFTGAATLRKKEADSALLRARVVFREAERRHRFIIVD